MSEVINCHANQFAERVRLKESSSQSVCEIKCNEQGLGREIEEDVCECHTCRCATKYLVPNKAIDEMIILTDSSIKGALIHNHQMTSLHNQEAFDMLYKALVSPVIVNIGEIADDEKKMDFIHDMLQQRIYVLVDKAPEKKRIAMKRVKKGDCINEGTNDHKRIKAHYAGEVITLMIEETTLYFYKTDQSLVLSEIPDTAISTHLYSSYMALYPKAVMEGIGSNCTACTTCAGCSVCAICTACEEVNFAASATAGIAGVSTSALNTTSLVFEQLGTYCRE